MVWILEGALEGVAMMEDKLDWDSRRIWPRSDEEEEICFDLLVGHVFGGQRGIPA